MQSRHAIIYVLFFVLAASVGVLGTAESHSEPPRDDDAIPAEALEALREGRYLRASLILREYLATHDSTPSAVLMAAQAEAGWGDWERVQQLLQGRSWLDRVADGYAWNLLGRSQIELGRYAEGRASLGRYLQMADTGGTGQAVALLRQAEAMAGRDDHAAALTAYSEAAELLPQMADWIRVFAASAAASAGDTAGVRERLAGLDPELAVEWAWRAEVRARDNAGDLVGAIVAAEEAAGRLTSATRQATAWTMVGNLKDRRQDRRGARTAWLRSINLAPGSSTAVEAARSLSNGNSLTVDDQLMIGRVYLRHGNMDRGLAGITAYLDAGRGTPAEREQLLYEIANAQFNGGNYAAAERALIGIAQSASDRRVAADALYTAARAQYRDGRQPAAMVTLERVIDDYSDQSAAVRAAYLTADLDHDARLMEKATDFYRQAIRLAPSSDEAAIARMRLGGIAFAEGRYEDALREFEEYRTTHRTGRTYQQATYWSGVTLQRLGRGDEARSRFVQARAVDPFSYYGGQAADETGTTVFEGRLEPEPSENEQFRTQVERALARVDLLREIGWEEAATYEMDRVRRHFADFDGALYALAEELNERGFTSQGIGLGWEIYRREGAWNRRLLRIVYPFPFQQVIVAEARERGVDPFLAAALIRQESMFNPRARSPVGALGLMQVMPRTGAALARNLGISGYRDEMLTQPEFNVVFGMAYLADQLRAYGNRLDVVLAAYNAGPGRVSRWREFPEFGDRLLFAERIPYDETRDYVRIVQNNRRLYAELYGGTLATEDQP